MQVEEVVQNWDPSRFACLGSVGNFGITGAKEARNTTKRNGFIELREECAVKAWHTLPDSHQNFRPEYGRMSAKTLFSLGITTHFPERD